MRLARLDEVFPRVCARCGAPMRILAFVTGTTSVTRVLPPLGEPAEPPPIAPARGPPEGEESFDQSPAYDPSPGEPDLGFEFDQPMRWARRETPPPQPPSP